jgi:hypothetical protein
MTVWVIAFHLTVRQSRYHSSSDYGRGSNRAGFVAIEK